MEEAKAWAVNQKLIDALKAMYDEDMKASSGNKSQYVNISKLGEDADPVLRDAASLLSKDAWDYAQSLFGYDEFWVRRDMLKDALGYRKASVGDAWTGNTRWDPKVQKAVKDMALAAFGNRAYQLLIDREQDVQDLVQNARTLIVVKSVVVPMANFVSNLYHLVGRGVPLASIVRGLPRKLNEIHGYTQNRLREIDLEAKLRVAEGKGDVRGARALKAEIQTIRDAHRRLSIWPLIEAGEFSSISDAGISRDELLMTGGRMQDYMERLTAKLPHQQKTPAQLVELAGAWSAFHRAGATTGVL